VRRKEKNARLAKGPKAGYKNGEKERIGFFKTEEGCCLWETEGRNGRSCKSDVHMKRLHQSRPGGKNECPQKDSATSSTTWRRMPRAHARIRYEQKGGKGGLARSQAADLRRKRYLRNILLTLIHMTVDKCEGKGRGEIGGRDFLRRHAEQSGLTALQKCL